MLAPYELDSKDIIIDEQDAFISELRAFCLSVIEDIGELKKIADTETVDTSELKRKIGNMYNLTNLFDKQIGITPTQYDIEPQFEYEF